MKATTNRRASKDTPNTPQKLCFQRPIMYPVFSRKIIVLRSSINVQSSVHSTTIQNKDKGGGQGVPPTVTEKAAAQNTVQPAVQPTVHCHCTPID